MGDTAGARFRPTVRQRLGRGLWLGACAGLVLLAVVALVVVAGALLRRPMVPSGGAWVVLVVAPPVLGALVGLLLGWRTGADVDAAGIRPGGGERAQPWAAVVDLRAERRGGRTVVQMYLDSGLVVQLVAPYDGGLLASDPGFERKLVVLAHLWRRHRIGGTVG